MDVKLRVKKYKTEGDIAWEYNPLRNIKKSDGTVSDFKDIDNSSLKIDLSNPVDIECQQSYDGSVNLILNDDKNPPRIINSRITKLENNRYKIINRNQKKQSNLYDEDLLDQETRLFRNIQIIPKLTLNKVSSYGQLPGGNYIFYLKYLDGDFNETDIAAETGIISVFNGDANNPKTCSGSFMDERTYKSIILSLTNIDTSFTYFNLYYVRNSCDHNGVLVQKAFKILENYEIDLENRLISITGYEEVEEISIEDLNIQYNYVDNVKTQAQVQNMLFFGNVDKPLDKTKELRNLSLHIVAEEAQDEKGIGFISPETFTISRNKDESQTEYYSPLNIYYKLGYVPGELYRFGIVYIFNDDHLSPVYNLRGCDFNKCDSDKKNYSFEGKIKDIELTNFLNKAILENTYGVFRFSTGIDIIKYSKTEQENNVYPLGIKFTIPELVINKLKEYNIKGYFFVRQKRIPNFLAQGFSIGVDQASSIPTLRNGETTSTDEGSSPIYISESFTNKSGVLTTDYKSRIIESNVCSSSGLLCVDAYVDKQLQSLFNGSEFKVSLVTKFSDDLETTKTRIYYPRFEENRSGEETVKKLVYVDSEISNRIVDNYSYSTKAGVQEEIKNLVSFGKGVTDKKDFYGYIRGIFAPFLGVQGTLTDNCIYSIYAANFNETFIEEYFTIRMNDKSPFYTVSPRYNLYNDSEVIPGSDKVSVNSECPIRNTYSSDYEWLLNIRQYLTECKEQGKIDSNLIEDKEIEEWSDTDIITLYNSNKIPDTISYCLDVGMYYIPLTFRGDCFTSTVCIRMHRNFTSLTVPTNDTIVDINCWKDNFKGERSTENWDYINKADIDAVPIGTWFVYKCISNYNLGLRSIDTFNTDEISLMGNPRSFYPLSDISVKAANKIPESSLLNSGYNVTLGVKRNYAFKELPYIKDIFDTRIMFSNVEVDGDFKNSYRIFQSLSYQDFDRQYGGIVKILPWENQLLCVFEHAIAIIPVNEKALLQTTTGQNIHMYGAGVLQKQITIITDKYGSTWKDSIVRTPTSLYGVDTYAKKIWRLSRKGLELISDFNIQRYLHDNINLKELDKDVILGYRNVKTHYNAYKNDLMFTFYNRDKVWNICYNEIIGKWVTRYSWTPLLSDNIDNSYFSFDLLKTRIFGIINNNLRNQESSEVYPSKPWNGVWTYSGNSLEETPLTLFINSEYNYFNIKHITIRGYSWNDKTNNLEEQEVYCKDFSDSEEVSVTSLDGGEFAKITIYNIPDQESDKYEYYNNNIKDKFSTITFKSLPYKENHLYYHIDVTYRPYLFAQDLSIPTEESATYIESSADRTYSVGLIIPFDVIKPQFQNGWNNALYSSIFVHGRANIIDEINYMDDDPENQILPTKWYNKQEPFEFEFIVNSPKGIHKIFDNLVIISNNVEPESLEIEIIGDVYDFDKQGIYNYKKGKKDSIKPAVIPEKVTISENDGKYYETEVIYDTVKNEYSLRMHQDCLNMKERKYGRRLGNIYYNNDVWYTVIQPIYYKDHEKCRSTRVRDKYAKIRVKYKGDKLVTITALQTLMTQSYV